MKIKTFSPEETINIGRLLGKLAVDRRMTGVVVCLNGDLGAGKTHFAKGVALGLEVNDNVNSPTFTLINEYEGRIPFYHVDAYRLEGEEVYDIGLEEYIYGDGLILIEWPERIKDILPEEFLSVNILNIKEDETSRSLEFTAHGQIYEDMLKELNKIVCSRN